jgi:hypothetical protein
MLQAPPARGKQKNVGEVSLDRSQRMKDTAEKAKAGEAAHGISDERARPCLGLCRFAERKRKRVDAAEKEKAEAIERILLCCTARATSPPPPPPAVDIGYLRAAGGCRCRAGQGASTVVLRLPFLCSCPVQGRSQ